MRCIYLIIALLLFSPSLFSREFPKKAQHTLDSMMSVGVANGYFPGATLAVGDKSGILYEKCYGYTDFENKVLVTSDHLYDIASVTKVVATTFAVMRLYDLKMIDINKKVGDYLTCYYGTPVNGITLSQLLTHTSGLPSIVAYPLLFSNPTGGKLVSNKYDAELFPTKVDANAYICANPVADPVYISVTPIEGFRKIADNIYVNPAVDNLVINKITESYDVKNVGRYKYSDTNFYILRQIIERISGKMFDEVTKELFKELEMNNTGFKPLDWTDRERIAPTEHDLLMGRGLIHGYVHDELSLLSGSIEGNSGIFSTASDLSNFCEMMLGDGLFREKRVLSSGTVRLFTSSPLQGKNIYRGLGFDKRPPNKPLAGGYGHTGFTGTMIWISKSDNVFMVFLSNRVYPTRINNSLSSSELRTKIWEYLKSNSK